ncbi:MAG TPA: esterase-like activity of phytase family protein [Allosphingosinicella sp.]|nr:esterase-like activity of phytase family protein [Allosphingosinicella sp.]
MKLARILNGRPARALFLLAALFVLATMVWPSPPPPGAGPAEASLTAVAVPLDAADLRRRRVGALLFRRGWSLSSEEPRFGGISAMAVERDRVTAISDAGVLLHFRLPRTAGGAQPLRVEPLPNSVGADKADHDTEAILLRGPQAWIAFERHNAVVRYWRGDWRIEAGAQPRPMRRWRGNSGPEAMVRLADGRFLIFSEGRDDEDPYSDVALFAGDPAERGTPAAALRFRRVPGFRVTDAALLPDGRLLILSRRFSWLGGISARLVVARTAGLGPGAVIEGREIADLGASLTVDNMEALSVTVEGGRTIVRIASDDNFMALQRTLLLEFELAEEPENESSSSRT